MPKTPSRRVRRIAAYSAGPVAILAAGLLIWQGSVAAFTAQTENFGNNWNTGSVTLSDDDLGQAMFSVPTMTPGQTGTKCIVVTSTSTVAGVVKVSGRTTFDTGLGDYVLIKVESGSGGTFNTCTGFVADSGAAPFSSLLDFTSAHSDFATGVLPWVTTGNAGGESKTYRFTWQFDTTGLSQQQIDALQGKAASAYFDWELQSN